ncbi:MAG: hypothetical protein II794_01915, partial [Oscillospiraceae bacterium]|nr:hypothetical protein [Oscillospiraceae bacterium]
MSDETRREAAGARTVTRRRKKRRSIGGDILIIVVLVGLFLTALFLGIDSRLNRAYHQSLTREAGPLALTAEEFLREEDHEISFGPDFDPASVDTSLPGTHTVPLIVDGKERSSRLTIKDTTSPTALPVSRVIDLGSTLEPADFVDKI